MAKTNRSRPRVTARRSAAKPVVARASREPAPLPPITIAGIGASAGGLEATTQLLQSLPAHSGIAIVIVQHLAPDHESSLPELLAPHTRMPVVQVSNGTRIERDHIYVIPPNVQMVITGGALELSPRPADRTQYTPIDTFFASLANIDDGRVIAVVLSGTASDGALGMREVKAAGGITIAQQPESAKYDSMPRAAIATGMVDLVLTPEQIGAEISEIASHPYVKQRRAFTEINLPDELLRRIFDLLRGISGVDFRHYKLPTIRRRLMRRMALHRLNDLDAYVKLLQSNPPELRSLFQDLLIHVTRFFREPESFDALTAEVFPKLLEHRDQDQPIRIWVCGCATGEEAYSLAITLIEFLQRANSDLRVQIFATDVSDTAIEHARAGVYPASIATDVGPERLRRFFTKTDGSFRVSKSIRDMCVFARQDLTKDPPFSRLDLVMCRNVLIYLDAALQRKLIALFHYALNPHGYLILGQAETVGSQASLFALTDKRFRIHRKKSVPRELPGAFSLEHPVLPLRKRAQSPAGAEHGLQAEVSRAILDRYAPAGVVVDADMQIVQFRGQTGPFLEPAPGDASLSLFKMAREGLLYGLRTAIGNVRKTKGPVRKDGLQIRVGHAWQPVAIEVIPLSGLGRPHYLVLFEHTKADAAPSDKPAAKSKKSKTKGRRKADDQKLVVLQRELAASREYMQSIIQELEAANEELQSANEEILSSNEELQSTNEELDTAKEELQSTNEELNTVNEELHGRNDEMSRINSDLINLVGSIQIAIVIVGSDLRIRRFTPMSEKILNLIPTDIDRAIGHINPNINCPDLEHMIIECMDTVAPIERDVQDRQGRWYSLRIRPYKSLDNKIDGAVLALFDVDVLKKAERKAALASDFAEAVLHFTAQPAAVLNSNFEIQKANAAFGALFNTAADDLRNRPLLKLIHGTSMDGWTGTHRLGAILPPLSAATAGHKAPLTLSGRVVPAIDGGDGQMILVTANGK